jgi:phosphoribosyl 1,2-cyclic phosphodiesterase
MSLFVASLNSGSNGNCYYVGTEQDAVLIDAGISCRETERRLRRLELNIANVKAIFISHEHGDHIGGLSRLSQKYGLPVYITSVTEQFCTVMLPETRAVRFKAYEPVHIGNLKVTAFPKFHDANDPHSFIVSSKANNPADEVHVGVFTDIGIPCEHVIKQFSQCHAAILESNYDEIMLEHGTYPLSLKRRIRGGKGHLSNRQALQLFTDHRSACMSHLFLAHLSHHNNSPKIVQDLFDAHAGNTKIVVASRYRETEVFHIKLNGNNNLPVKSNAKRSTHQLNLFQ